MFSQTIEIHMKKILLLIASIPLFINSYGGMWEPYQMPELRKELREAGFYKNVKDLGNKIEYLLKYPKKINEYGKRGKEKYFKLFNNKIITKKIIEKTF